MKSELHKKIREENYAIRFLVYIVGLFIMTLGISLSVKSNLGVSPVSSIPYTITCITGLEMGKATILFHIVLVVMQILILRKAFQMKNLLQVVVVQSIRYLRIVPYCTHTILHWYYRYLIICCKITRNRIYNISIIYKP